MLSGNELRQSALDIWLIADIDTKQQAIAHAFEKWGWTPPIMDTEVVLQTSQEYPGRPSRPVLVEPKALKHRSMATTEGRASLIHALAHIEWNAVNLGLDALWRFPNMPSDYYLDWWRVTVEESKHFGWLNGYLRQYTPYQYGDFPAHDGMWEMANRTRDDVLARMALVPRTLEARGLDACPGMRDKLLQAKEPEAANIVQAIYEEEIGHVQIGNRWFHYLCEQRDVDALSTYLSLAESRRAPYLKAPINVEARLAAGFTAEELKQMQVELTPATPA